VEAADTWEAPPLPPLLEAAALGPQPRLSLPSCWNVEARRVEHRSHHRRGEAWFVVLVLF